MPRKRKGNAKKNAPRRTKTTKSPKKGSKTASQHAKAAKKSNRNTSKRQGQAFSKDLLPLLNQLTSVLREVDGLKGNPLYETSIKLDEICDKLMILQSGTGSSSTQPQSLRRQIWGFEGIESSNPQILLNRLTLWMKRQQPDSFIGNTFEFAADLAEGRGVIACRDLKQGEHTMSIDRKLMMTHSFAMTQSDDKMRRFLRCDPLCLQVSSLAMVLFVWYERMKGSKSFWKPYLDALPLRFGLPHEFAISDLVSFLSGSHVLEAIIRLKIFHLRHYTYARQMLSRAGIQPGLRLVDYLWAAGVIMTRQNKIPSQEEEKETEIALIPGWDMCNYANGRITSYFNTKQNRNEMFAMRDTRKGEQIYIYYGAQRNQLLFLNSGFVFDDNRNDELQMDLRLEPQTKDALFKIKAIQIRNAQLSNPLQCVLPILHYKRHKGEPIELLDVKVEDAPQEDKEEEKQIFAEDDVSTEWIASVFETLGLSVQERSIRFARIAQMNKSELTQFMRNKNKDIISPQNEFKAWNMIADNAQMMSDLWTDKLRICAEEHLKDKDADLDAKQVINRLRAIHKPHVALTFELLHIERTHYANIAKAIASGIHIIKQRFERLNIIQ
eukprot:87821_1